MEFTRFADMGIGIPQGLKEFFGDGSDGALNSTGNITYAVAQDSGFLYKQFTEFILNAGHTMTVDNRCRGLVIYSQGDVIINGTIDMSEKGGAMTNDIPPLIITKKMLFEFNGVLADILGSYVGGAGGAGGYGTRYHATWGGAGGSGGAGRFLAGGFGGGGGGGTYKSSPTSYADSVGGFGGSILNPDVGFGIGGYIASNTMYDNINKGSSLSPTQRSAYDGINGGGGGGAYTGSFYGINGGKCNGAGGGGGVGHISNPISSMNSDWVGKEGGGCGGCVIIIAKGNITIGSGGYIKANGGAGGAGGFNGTAGFNGGGGGGAGGGVILLHHKGTYTNNGTVQANGGSGGARTTSANGSPSAGAAGSIGTIRNIQL